MLKQDQPFVRSELFRGEITMVDENSRPRSLYATLKSDQEMAGSRAPPKENLDGRRLSNISRYGLL